MSPELTDLSLTESLALMRVGQLSSTELTQACLQRIEKMNPDLHAFLTITPELALQLAEAADRTWAAWRKDNTTPLPPLLGLPLAVKDVLSVKGVRCTCGSLILEQFIPPYNATAVERLLAAGVVILGKTNIIIGGKIN